MNQRQYLLYQFSFWHSIIVLLLTEPQTSVTPRIRDGEKVVTGRKVVEAKMNVAINCDAQGYPTPAIRSD